MTAPVGSYYAGKGSRAQVEATNLRKTDWNVDYKTDKIDTSNFEGGGFDQSIVGLYGADWGISGLWDASGSQQLSDPPGLYPRYDLGDVKLYLNVTAALFWEFTQNTVTSAKNSTQVRDAVKFEAAACANGAFSVTGAGGSGGVPAG